MPVPVCLELFPLLLERLRMNSLLDQSRDNKTGVPRTVSVFGATGSIGMNTLDLLGRNSKDYTVVALTANRNVRELAGLAVKYGAQCAVVADDAGYADLKEALAGSGIEALAGETGMLEAAARPADITMAAVVGAAGIKPSLEAIKQGNCLALANKECLVAAGELFMSEVARYNTRLLPVDSEHSAVYQSLDKCALDRIDRVILTASGGPFRTKSLEEIGRASKAQALKHPNWSMGQKITIDSATMMNKGLEIIEAYHLFPVSAGQIDVVVHPESIIHGMVEYEDGSVIAQMGSPDMRTPIAYSLAWPGRMPCPSERLDFARLGKLTFEAPDEERFPALRVAREALESGGNAPTILNACNEIAVEAFLNGQINLLAIAAICAESIDIIQKNYGSATPLTLEDVLHIDSVARKAGQELVSNYY